MIVILYNGKIYLVKTQLTQEQFLENFYIFSKFCNMELA